MSEIEANTGETVGFVAVGAGGKFPPIGEGAIAGAKLAAIAGAKLTVGELGATSTGEETGASVLSAAGLPVEVTGDTSTGGEEGTSIGILMSLCSDLQMPLKSSWRVLSISELSVAATSLALVVRRLRCTPPTVSEFF